VKKLLLFSLIFITALCACNRKAFINKLTGTWKANKYIFNKQDMTASFLDTTHVNYQLSITSDQRYSFTWITRTYIVDSVRVVDTVGGIIDTVTVYHVDSTVTPGIESGAWVLLNSEQDIQLTADSNLNDPIQYQILKLSSNSFNILKGNQEYDFTK
jgi:hypothetical protein